MKEEEKEEEGPPAADTTLLSAFLRILGAAPAMTAQMPLQFVEKAAEEAEQQVEEEEWSQVICGLHVVEVFGC